MQGHGYNRIDIVIQTTLLQISTIPAAEVIGCAPHIAILEMVDCLAPLTTLDIPQKCRCALDGHKACKVFTQRIFFTLPEIC
jgi:hypothetical protein